MLARVRSMALRGIDAFPVTVELDVANGLPGFVLVGLADHAVKEARERVMAAVRNSGFQFPKRRVTVNLAPAPARKGGSHLDLPIALAALRASGQAPEGEWAAGTGFLGELALDGSVRPVAGILSMALKAKEEGWERLVTSADNAEEAAASGLEVWGVRTLREAVDALAEGKAPAPVPNAGKAPRSTALDLCDVKGQELAKRALEIAAAGGHNLLLVGPPGVGKSLLARRLPGLLPPPSAEEALEITRVHGAQNGLAFERPFRSPHHTCSAEALIGGGASARPGEAALAHGGVLFLDELTEFDRRALESLRQPLEDGRVSVARAAEKAEYPARFMLVAATNPCPCGLSGAGHGCRCTPHAVEKFRGKLSGPWLDRIDLQVELAPLSFESWSRKDKAEGTAEVHARVIRARQIQAERYGAARVNAALTTADLPRHCALGPEGLKLLEGAAATRRLSARSLDRALKVARTIADLAGSGPVEPAHVAEALIFKGGFI
jgi:magnesium chelatase family protein